MGVVEVKEKSLCDDWDGLNYTRGVLISWFRAQHSDQSLRATNHVDGSLIRRPGNAAAMAVNREVLVLVRDWPIGTAERRWRRRADW